MAPPPRVIRRTEVLGVVEEWLAYGEDPSVATPEGRMLGGPYVRTVRLTIDGSPAPAAPHDAPQTKPKRRGKRRR